MNETLQPGRDAIRAAALRLSPWLRRTPILRLAGADLGLPHDVVLKLELLQASGSHCIRGHSYSKNKDFDICQGDLAFLSACDTSELQALCADPEGR